MLVERLQVGLDRSDIADDAILGQERHYLVEGLKGVFYGYGVDDQFGTESLDFFFFRKPVAIVHEAQPLRVGFEYSHFVLKAQYIGKEGAHFAGSQYQNFHLFQLIINSE